MRVTYAFIGGDMTQLSGAIGARSLGQVLGRRCRARGPGGAWIPRKKCARADAARIRRPPPAGARASVPPMAEGGTSRKAPTFSASVVSRLVYGSLIVSGRKESSSSCQLAAFQIGNAPASGWCQACCLGILQTLSSLIVSGRKESSGARRFFKIYDRKCTSLICVL